MSSGWIEDEKLFPYDKSIALSQGGAVTADVIVMKTFPAFVLVGSEPNALFSETREVGGDLWITTNATFEPASPATPNQWTAVNAAVASYATVLRGNGTVDRLVATAGSTAPLAWVTVAHSDAAGELDITPGTLTSSAQIPYQAAMVWNAPGQIMTGQLLDVVDTASAAGSFFQNFRVSGSSKWSVRKDGTLVAGVIPTSLLSGTIPSSSITGSIPFSQITGTVPVNQGGTGVTTLASSPFVVLNPGSQQSGAINVSGAITAGGTISSGGIFQFTGSASANFQTDFTNVLYRAAALGGAHYFENSNGSIYGHIDAGGYTTQSSNFSDTAVIGSTLNVGTSINTGQYTGSTMLLSSQLNVGSTAIASLLAAFGGSAGFAGQVTVTPNDGTSVSSHIAPIKYLSGAAYGANLRCYNDNIACGISSQPAGNLCGSVVVNFPVGFNSAANYTITATAENFPGFVEISSKNAGNVQLNLYNLQASSAGTVFIDFIAIGE